MKSYQKRSERVSARLPVRYGLAELEHSTFAENISETGLFISTNEVFQVGTRLHLELEISGRTVHQVGMVTWAIRVPEHQRGQMVHGMGIEFVRAGLEWPEIYRDWLASPVAP